MFIVHKMFAGRKHGIGRRVVDVDVDGRMEVTEAEYEELIGIQGYLPDDRESVISEEEVPGEESKDESSEESEPESQVSASPERSKTKRGRPRKGE